MFQDIGDYVYDLYYAQTSDDVWLESNNILVQQPEYPEEDDCEDENESSDSNAESHWKNDYPDMDPDLSSDSSNESSEFDIFKDTDNIQPVHRYKYSFFGTRYDPTVVSNSDEGNSSDSEESSEVKSSDDEVKLEDEVISDERMDDI